MSFDVIGSIAIIKPQNYAKKEKELSSKLLNLKSIKTVAKKISKVKGRLRLMKLKIIAGANTKETIHKENNCLIKLDVEKCYFSPRLGSDRLDIAKQTKRGEKILVMFAGTGAYALVISKNSKAKEIYAIELNKIACKYFQENLRLNKISNIKIIQGDVKKIIPVLNKKGLKFDRILMPRPQLKETFLRDAFKVSKKNTLIHYYDFLKQEEILDIQEKIEKQAKSAGKKIKILLIKKAGELAPFKYRLRVDFVVK